MRIVLASQSLLRKRAFGILGLQYETKPSNFDERSIRHEKPKTLVRKLAVAKARTVAKGEKDAIIVAGDLFVVHDNRFYEKPSDTEEAFRMLKEFSGKRLQIVAGLAVFNTSTKKMESVVKSFAVRFRILTDEEIHDYVSRYPVTTFAAAFEGDGLLRFAATSHGSYPFLTGFPMAELVVMLRSNGVKV